VSAERVVCGAGLVELYHALCELCGDTGLEITTPADVMARAQAQPGSTAHDAVFEGSGRGDVQQLRGLAQGQPGTTFLSRRWVLSCQQLQLGRQPR
jgi:glucokinase